MPKPATSPGPRRRRRRDGAANGTWLSDNVKWVLSTLAMPVALSVISVALNHAANLRAAEDRKNAEIHANADRLAAEVRAVRESRSRLYTEMLAKREEADAAVRRGVFEKLMGSYLTPASGDLDSKTVALELLALNFHDAVNLSPLFWQLDRQIEAGPAELRPRRRAELQRIALEIKHRQVAMLMPDEPAREISIDMREMGAAGHASRTVEVKLNDPAAAAGAAPLQRRFNVVVYRPTSEERRLQLQVEDLTEFDARRAEGPRDWTFYVDLYDFPLVNFTRLSRDERLAVVLDSYQHGGATLRFLYFPSSRGGSKDKPYIEDVWSTMRGPAGDPLAGLPAPGAGPASASPPGPR